MTAIMLEIRPVEPGDGAEWLRLRLALWPNASPAAQAAEIAAFFAGPAMPLPGLGAVFVCVLPQGGLCGLVEASIHDHALGCTTERVGYLEGWYVEPEWRQRGVGGALVAKAEAWAAAQGCTEMASDTDPSYPLSPAAHAALGYAEVQRYFRKDLSRQA